MLYSSGGAEAAVLWKGICLLEVAQDEMLVNHCHKGQQMCAIIAFVSSNLAKVACILPAMYDTMENNYYIIIMLNTFEGSDSRNGLISLGSQMNKY